MQVSGFTFLRNAQSLGYPFLQSIQSILPICDEFVVCLGHSNDNTLALLQGLNEPKLKIIPTHWNEHMRRGGFVYAQQKMIAQYACQGEWLFYLEADELVHEADLPVIQSAMQKYLTDDRVEALAFDYYHFYGNINTLAYSPAWYRRETRIIKASVRSYAPDGLFWVVLDKSNRHGRYPYAKLSGAKIYHYGWVRSQEAMQEKSQQVNQYWDKCADEIDYRDIDPQSLKLFSGQHPAIIADFFPAAQGLFHADPQHQLTRRERKHRWLSKLEKCLSMDFSKRHFIHVKK